MAQPAPDFSQQAVPLEVGSAVPQQGYDPDVLANLVRLGGGRTGNAQNLQGFNPEFGGRMGSMLADFEAATGRKALLTSGTRSRDDQAWMLTHGTARAAAPGTSPHEEDRPGGATAADFDTRDVALMDRLGLLDRYGLQHLRGSEFHHVQLARDAAPEFMAASTTTPVPDAVPPAPALDFSKQAKPLDFSTQAKPLAPPKPDTTSRESLGDVVKAGGQDVLREFGRTGAALEQIPGVSWTYENIAKPILQQPIAGGVPFLGSAAQALLDAAGQAGTKPAQTTGAAGPIEFGAGFDARSILNKTLFQVTRAAPSAAAAIFGGLPAAALETGAQNYGDYFDKQLAATPHDKVGAMGRAAEDTAIDMISTAVGWKLFDAVKPFKGAVEGTITNNLTGEIATIYKQRVRDIIGNLMTQGVAVQPAVGMVTTAAHNLVSGKPLLDGLPQDALQGVLPNIITMGFAHALGGGENTALGPWRKSQGPWAAGPEAAAGSIEPEGPPGGGAGAAQGLPSPARTTPQVLPEGATVGLKTRGGMVPVTVKAYSPDGRFVTLNGPSGQPVDMLTEQFLRDHTTEVPEVSPEDHASFQHGRPRTQAETEAVPASGVEEPFPFRQRLGRSTNQPELDPRATQALDLADRLEKAALDPMVPMPGADREAAIMQAARLRQQYGVQPGPEGYRHPMADEPAAGLGPLARARVEHPEDYQGEYVPEKPPPIPRTPAIPVSHETKPKPPQRPQDLAQFISEHGGITPASDRDAGELKSIGANRHFVPGYGTLVRKQGGMPLDYARQLAAEAGYGDAHNGLETTNDLLSALDDHMRGTDVFSIKQDGDDVRRWQEWRQLQRMNPDEPDELPSKGLNDQIDDLRQKAEYYRIPVGDDWSPEDLMAAVTEHEALADERGHGEPDTTTLANQREMDMDYYLANRWPEVWGHLRDEGLVETGPVSIEGERPAEQRQAPGAGEPSSGQEPVAGAEEVAPSLGGHPEEHPATAPVRTPIQTTLLEAPAETPEQRRAREGRKRVQEAQQTPRAHGRKPQRDVKEGLFEPPADATKDMLDVHSAAANAHPEPSETQVKAGNYKHGHTVVQGIPVSIENAAGSERRGVGPSGEPWAVRLKYPYGYVKGSKGADGDHVDVYIGHHPDSPDVFIVDQVDPASRDFDEHKAILGARSEEEAKAIYDSGFSDGSGPDRVGAITAMPVDQFREWLDTHQKEPVAYQRPEPVSAAPMADALDERAEQLGLTLPPRASESDVAAAVAERELMVTPDATADRQRDAIEASIDAIAQESLPEALEDAAWNSERPEAPAPQQEQAEGAAPSGERPEGAGEEAPRGEVAGARPAGGGEPEREGAPARLEGRPVVRENEERNGVEIKFGAKPPADILGRLKAAGFRWSKPQKLWYAKRSPKTLEVANSLKGAPPVAPTKAVSVSEHVELTAAQEGGRAEQDATIYRPASMPITDASPAPEGVPADERFEPGDAVAPKPENASALPTGDGTRFVTGVSPDGSKVTLDGGATLSADEIEPIGADHGLQKPIHSGIEGERSGSLPGSREAPGAGAVPAGQEPGSPSDAGRPAGVRIQGSGRSATRPTGAPPRGRAGDVADAGLPGAGERPASGTAGRPDRDVTGTNFHIEPGALDEGRGPKAKALDNLAAIELVQRLHAEDRPATRAEQAILARYVGWGGLSGAFERPGGGYGTGFEDVGRRLKKLLTPEQYQTASRSTQYAHYTAENVIRSMWDAVEAMGFEGGNVFEPGMGVGHFLGLMPPDMAAASRYQGIELDHLTADIAKLLYPRSGVRQADFTETPMPDNAFDLVIGNPPFSDTVIKSDPRYAPRGFMLHDYFFAKSLDTLRPGGILGFVTSVGTMNKIDRSARTYMAERAEFLGGVRLPSTAFKKNAGTEVTTDVLFFKKRPEAIAEADAAKEPWVGTTIRDLPTAEGGNGQAHVSNYFTEHPEQVLGREGLFDKLYKGRYAVHADEGADLTANMREALDRLPKDIYAPPLKPAQIAAMDFGSPERKDGSFYVRDGQLMQYSDGRGQTITKNRPDTERITKLIPVRDALRQVFEHDLAERPEAAAIARQALNRAYDDFVGKFGPINTAKFQLRRPTIIQQESARLEAREAARDRGEPWHDGSFDPEPMLDAGASMQDIARARQTMRERIGADFREGTFSPGEIPDVVIEKRPNIDPFMDDPESHRLRSIEHYNDATGEHSKKRIFFESVIAREQEPVLNSANDGVLWSLNQHGRLDLDKIAAKMGRTQAELVAELGDKVFRLPGTEASYQTADEYLSGDVVTKLDEAKEASLHDQEMERNVSALQAALPAPLAPSEISMTLGMPWMPSQTVEEFASDHLGIGHMRIKHNGALGGWTVDEISRGDKSDACGTPDVKARQMLADALNRTPKRVYTEVHEPDGGKKRVFDPVATQAVEDKYNEIREAFRTWLHEDEGRLDGLASVYNDKLNRVVSRKFDGSYLTTPGISSEWKWRPHQRRVVARVIQAGNTYVAHAVGAGKAQPLDAKVLTPTGWKLMGDIEVGDQVIAGDGAPTAVTGVFPQGEKDIFRVEFSDGSSTECCDEHLWLTSTYAERSQASKVRKNGRDWACAKPKVRALADIRGTMVAVHLGSKNHSIPIVAPVRFNAQACAIDPYLLGVLLGDGYLDANGINVSSADQEILGAVRASLPDECVLVHQEAYDWRVNYTGKIAYAVGRGGAVVSHPVRKALLPLGLMGKRAHEKWVPGQYLFNTPEVRLAVLQGLLDTDGWVSKRGHSVYFTSTSKRLADDVSFIVRSLGGVTQVKEKHPQFTYMGVRKLGRVAYNVCIALPPDVMPFRLTRKAVLVVPKTKYVPARYIVGVRSVGKKLAQCIRVAHHSHLYVTDDFIVTHNTSEMIGAGMEMRRLGLVRKPLYVVPNHMLGQFTKEFYEQYPTANIAVADERRFHTDRRKQFVANVAQDDLDAVIMTHASFGKIPISKSFQRKIIQEEIDKIAEAMGGLNKGDDRITIKRLENQKEKLEQRLMGAMKGRKDQTVTFEEMAPDFVFVDEAHNFRKLNFASRQNLKGIDPKGSDMAFDLYSKLRYLETKNPGRSAVLASGTPVTNTMGELYTISRYLQREELQARGLDHFDSWASTFGDTKTALEQTADGGYQPMTRFSRFVNIPELYKMVAQVMDIVTPAQLDEYVVRPKLKGGKRTLNVAPKTDALEAYQASLAARMDEIRRRKRPPVKGDDIMLSVINDGRHAAIDMRFVRDGQPDPHSKLNMMIDNVHRIWERTRNQQFYDPRSNYADKAFKGPATQMIFANLGVNERGPMEFSGYKWIKEALRRKGIPPSEIAFIGDYKTHVARHKLFNDMNEGRIRILVGSTQKMGTGVNAQRRLYAIHNQDPLWFPADDEQRVGRGLRQGNFNPEIEVQDYTTKGTYDSAMWGMMGRKGRFIEQFFRGDPTLRDMEDLGEAGQYEQASAISTADERIIQLTDLKQQLDRAERREQAHDREQYSMRHKLTDRLADQDWLARSIEAYEGDIQQRVPTAGDAFEMRVAGKTYRKRGDAADALDKAVKDTALPDQIERAVKLATLGGFNIRAWRGKYAGLKFLRERSDGTMEKVDVDTPAGVIRSMESTLPRFENIIESLRKNMAQNDRAIASLRSQLGKSFEGGDEIKRLTGEVRDLEGRLATEAKAREAERGAVKAQVERPTHAKAEGPFYSALTRGVEALPQAKAPAAQWSNVIDNLRNKGVKQEEIEWSGVKDWLKDQTGPVTKQALLDYLRANEVQVKEVGLGGADYEDITPDQKAVAEYSARFEALNEKIRPLQAKRLDYQVRSDSAQLKRVEDELAPLETARDELADQMIADTWDRMKAAGTASVKPTKFASYTLPGGQNYRELLLTLPEASEFMGPYKARQRSQNSDTWHVVDRDGEPVSGFGYFRNGDWYGMTREGPDTSSGRTLAERLAKRLNDERHSVPQPVFRSSHFDEPNVLAHVRFDDRAGPNGEKVLHISEIQSDWSQKGRREGFAKPLKALPEGYTVHEVAPLANDRDRQGTGLFAVWDQDGRPVAKGAFGRDEAVSNALKVLSRAGVPDMPFKSTESWAGLAAKRMLRYAAEHGYDKLTFDTGSTQADRYDLSKQVDHIGYNLNDDGTVDIAAFAPDGRDKPGQMILSDEAMTLSKVADTFGKDIADKIKNNEGEDRRVIPEDPDSSVEKVLRGDDLKVGGEGMRGFYDRILPQFLNKYAKKWGAKVESGTFRVANTDRYSVEPLNDGGVRVFEVIDSESGDVVHTAGSDDAANDWVRAAPRDKSAKVVHSISITPVMRESVMGGQPLFQPGAGEGARGSERLSGDLTAQPLGPLRPHEKRMVEDVNRIIATAAPGAEPKAYARMALGNDPISGAFYRRGARGLIAWSIKSPHAIHTGFHEVVHYLRNLGFITPEEWQKLAEKAEKDDWIGKHRVEKDWPWLTERGDQIEEAVAEEAGWKGQAHYKPKPAQGVVGRTLARIRELLSRIGRYVRKTFGTENADDIMHGIVTGEIGGRKLPGFEEETPPRFDEPGYPRTKAQAERTPDGPPETPEDGRDYIDNVAGEIAAHIRGQGPGAYERELQRLSAPSGPETFLKPNWGSRHVLGPRTAAEVDTKSGRLWNVIKAQDEEGISRIHGLRDTIKPFLKLSKESQAKVHAVRELDRLDNRTREDTGHTIVARNDGHEYARSSKPGERIVLDGPGENEGYFAAQAMDRKAWDNIMEGAARRMGWNQPWTPKIADNLKAISDAAEQAQDGRSRRALGRLADVLSAMEEQRRAAYAPLMRFGDYFVAVKQKPGPGVDSLGGFPETAWFELVEQPSFQWADMNPAKIMQISRTGDVPDHVKPKLDELRQRFPADKFSIEHGWLFRKPDTLRTLSIPAVDKLFMVMESGVLNKLAVEATEMGADKAGAKAYARKKWGDLYQDLVDAVQDEMYEQLRAGFKKRAKVVPGYSGDWNRSMGSYINWTSRHVAKQIHGDAFERAYDDIQAHHPSQEMRRFWEKWRKDDEDPASMLSRTAITANQVGFLYTMAMNPASTVSIAMHGPTYAVPVLSTGIGMKKAAPAFANAYGAVIAASRGSYEQGGLHIDLANIPGLKADERTFLTAMEQNGELHAKGADDVRNMAEKASGLFGEKSEHARKAMDILSSNIAVADQANRYAASLAAYRLAKDNLGAMNETWSGNQVWRDLAQRDGVTPETMAHFLLTQAVGEWGTKARSELGRSWFGRLATSLHGFQIRFISNLFRQMFTQRKAGRIAAAWTYAALWFAAGLQGLPFVQDAENVMDFVWRQMTSKDPMIAARLRALIANSGFGKLGADLVLRGPLSAMTGIDFASRLGFGDIITRDVVKPLTDGVAAEALTVPSIIAGAISGYKRQMKSRQPVKAVGSLLPGAVRHVINAEEDYRHGIRSQSGRTTYVPKGQVTPAMAIKEAAGFTPLDVARKREHADFRYRARQPHVGVKDMVP